MKIRDFRPADWTQIWPYLHDIVAAGETYCWPTDTTEEAARAWWCAKPGGRVFVAEDAHGSIVGTAELHPNQPAGGSHVANAGFMVAAAAAGSGIGRALGVHVIDAAARDGYRAMQFNAVVETNVGAVHLWQSLGFEILATIPGAFAHPGQGDVGLHVMYRSLL